MAELLFPAPNVRTLSIVGDSHVFPVHRIFCVGRNYADHAKEMGVEVDRVAPFYFTKSLAALRPGGVTIAYPPGTSDFHYEMELVVAIGRPAFHVRRELAQSAIFGFACGLDMTRRDLQLAARAKQRPWDTGKDVENSAIVGPITKAETFGPIGPQRIWLAVNGELRQEAHLSDMIWHVADIVSHLSSLYHLAPGDLIFTGTPAGVGPVVEGDMIEGGIDTLSHVRLAIGPAE